MKRTVLCVLTGVLVVGVSPAFASSPGTAPEPGSLLQASGDPTRMLGIEPMVQQEIQPGEAQPVGPNASMGDYDPDNPPREAEFHIINGPNASDHFTGIHYTAILYSRYRQEPSEPLTQWIHYSWGPNESKFWKFVPGR